ncbi:hypothetical protein [Nonomuraea guangzhouensis]|uniref:Uncharacterized protein n=1 Tax=Nonomuraea guangzhouensis TaxID=1291555 RepID=A0ABW4GE91_9ACTN|nr:hypothetical protein [Nonomuraea guangzhouensis]
MALTTPGALDAIAASRPDTPAGSLVGAGTEADVADVVAAGGQFVVTPGVMDSIGAVILRGSRCPPSRPATSPPARSPSASGGR